MRTLFHNPYFSVKSLTAALVCRAKSAQFPLKPGGEEGIPMLFDNPEFFVKIAEKSLTTGCSPDLLFFAFYFQPVRQTLHALHIPHGQKEIGTFCSIFC